MCKKIQRVQILFTLTEQKELGSIVKLAIAKMHKPLVFKCFRSLKKLFTNHCFGCRLNLTILADLRHSKQQLCWPHCYSSSVLMVIRVTMCCYYSYSCVTVSHPGIFSDMGYFSGQLLDTHQVITMRQYSNSSKYLIDSSLASTI